MLEGEDYGLKVSINMKFTGSVSDPVERLVGWLFVFSGLAPSPLLALLFGLRTARREETCRQDTRFRNSDL